jgi:hypothetical protein
MAGKKGISGPKPGSANAARPRIWSDAVRRAVLQGKKLDKLAERLIAAAEGGDMQALKEIGDRIEGKVTQTVAGENGPIQLVVTWQK